MNIKGIALLTYGLNNNHALLHDLKKSLTEINIEVHIVLFQGHHLDSKNINEVSAHDWIEDFSKEFKMVKNKSRNENIPLFLFGYSLGATVIENFLIHHPGEKKYIAKIIYFAPALFIKKLSYHFIKLIKNIRFKKLISLTPKEFQANSHLPLNAFQALFELAENFRNNQNHFEHERLIFMEPKDEVVDFNATLHFAQNHFPPHRLIAVQKSSQARYPFNHLIMSQDDHGEQQWDDIFRIIKEFIQ